MISLLIDTCTKQVCLGIFKDTNPIDEVILENEKDLSGSFLAILDDLLFRNGLVIKDIEKIYVAVGPGSFTGVRIGVTCAKVLGWALNKKIIPFSSLELIATTAVEADLIVPLIDARRGFVFAGVYNDNLDVVLNDNYILSDDLVNKLDKTKTIAYISLDDFNFKTEKPLVNMRKIIERHSQDKGIDPHCLNPNYLKKTEAEEKLEKL